MCQDSVIEKVYVLVQSLLAMLRREQPERLGDWLDQARQSGVDTLARFADHLAHDRDAVVAAMRGEWSNGQVEGQVTD